MGNKKTSEEREQLVERARQGWIRRLIDKSRRNHLLYFKLFKTSSLDLTQADPGALLDLLAGKTVCLDEFFPDDDLQRVFSIVKEIKRRSIANFEERGLETLYIAAGLATWPSADGGTPIESPIVLLPVKIDQKGRDVHSTYIAIEGEPQLNLVLARVLEDDFSISLDEDQLLPANGESTFDISQICSSVKELVGGKIAGFEVSTPIVLGVYLFQKMAMVKDLLSQFLSLTQNDIIAAIAGDVQTQKSLSTQSQEQEPRHFDDQHPRQELLILDADSSQQRAVNSILGGQNGVVQGPPGTGKSQTIANLISTSVAQGKKILFVSEKRAALEVVLQRLRNCGLGELALDLHGTESKQQKIVEQIAKSFDSIRTSVNIDYSDKYERLLELRKRLNKHAAEVNDFQLPSQLSVITLQGNILRCSEQARIEVRWKGKELRNLTHETVRVVMDLFKEAEGFEHEMLRNSPSPWNGAAIPTGNAAQTALDEASRLSKETLPKALVAINEMVAKIGFRTPLTVTEAQIQLELLNTAANILDTYRREFFDIDLQNLKEVLSPLVSIHKCIWAYAANAHFRSAVMTVRSVQHKKSFVGKGFLKGLDRAISCKTRWSEYAQTKGKPIKYAGLRLFGATFTTLHQSLTGFHRFFPARDTLRLSFDELGKWLTALSSDRITPFRLVKLHGIEEALATKGVQNVLTEIKSKAIPAKYWQECFEYAWWSSCLEETLSRNPEMAGFNGASHGKFVDEFATLDAERLKLNVKVLKNLHARKCIDAMNRFPQQASFVRHEAAKKRGHKPLRRIMNEAPDVLLSLFPCWMASPLSISQVVKADKQLFDLVVFDEASQVLPEDAIPAIMRAKQVVVAGDTQQLPPTTFFAASEEDEDAEENYSLTQGVESILDTLSSFLPSWWLEWHYRSKDESLIAFSNRHIYGDRLISFPNPLQQDVIHHEHVDSVVQSDIETESSASEVKRVVELIVRHAEENPDETLGVIALGIKHANRIEAALDQTLALRRDLDEFFDQQSTERFFVKNLERVQGDGRDAIILSVGYGKDRSGKLLYRFGPLLYEGGERRLNVAITRARKRLTIVSSFEHTDMDPAKCKSRGMWLLREYLQYAAHNGHHLSDSGPSDTPLNQFELDVYETLKQKGVSLIPQYGVSRYRIDFAVTHPQQAGRFIMALECDGASYHSSPTAMERDRLRQSHLEALGWRFHRIWSSDWFYRKPNEVQRFMEVYAKAKESRESPKAQKSDYNGKGGDVQTTTPTNLRKRISRPYVPQGMPIGVYSTRQIADLIKWIMSDGQLRTDEEIIDEAVKEMGFARRGKNIVAELTYVISGLRKEGKL